MKEQLISLKTGKLAKEKGFNEVCNSCYDINGKVYHGMNHKNDLGENVFSAPTQSLLQKWLREVHNIDIFITEGFHVVSKYKVYTDPSWGEFKELKTYEEALEIGLQEALKLIK